MVQLVLTEQADSISRPSFPISRTKPVQPPAERYAREFDALFERLIDFPRLGPPRNELGPNLRICIVSPYLAFYEYEAVAERIVVLRILHGRRNITERLLKP